MNARYSWVGWCKETELGNADDREDVWFLTITDRGEEMAVIIHRTVNGQYPLDGGHAMAKEARAQMIVDALNANDPPSRTVEVKR